MPSLLTIGQIASHLGEREHRIDYVVKSRSIAPAGRVANLRVFDESGVDRIKRELTAIDRRRELATR